MMIMFFLLVSSFAYSDSCQQKFKNLLEGMNLGTLNNPSCSTKMMSSEQGLRFSSSKLKGRKDTGKTLNLYRKEDGVKVVQLLSKDLNTGHRHKYIYRFNKNCDKINGIDYTMGGLRTELNLKKCSDIENEFEDIEINHLSIIKLCEKFFSKESPIKAEDNKTNKSIKIEKK